MAALGPFEPAPRIAAGVSGGADSMALALLADAWARRARWVAAGAGGRPRTAPRVGPRGGGRRWRGLSPLASRRGCWDRRRWRTGPALAERARAARFAVLEAACAEAGILHLLLGHHAGDQAETLLIRVARRQRAGGHGRHGAAGGDGAGCGCCARCWRSRRRGCVRRCRLPAWHGSRIPRTPMRRRCVPACACCAATTAATAAATAALRCGRRPAAGAARERDEAPLPSWLRGRVAAGGLRRAVGTAARAAGLRGAAAGARRGAVSARHAGRSPHSPRRRGRRRWRRPAAAGGPAGPGPACRARGGGHGAAGSGAARRRLGRAISSRSTQADVPPGATLGRAGRRCGAAAPATRRFPPPCCGPCRRSGTAPRFSPCRICTILTVRGARDFPMLFSPPRPAVAAPFWFGDA